VTVSADLVVVGGGIAGLCAAIAAARRGARVTLVQDRPVLGGNASSEVRLWLNGALSHGHNNNRWSREGGIADEILVENLYRNPEGNPVLVDGLLLEKVLAEPNIRLLLNTAVDGVRMAALDRIAAVSGFCAQNSTRYELAAPLFCDASGDGIVGYLAGAPFRMGAEAPDEFDEPIAPDGGFGGLLGHSIYFYSRDTGRPVRFVPPAFALDDITRIPRYRSFSTKEHGCRLWWIEYGGHLDTVHDTEEIKWELWRVVYGVWNHIKNSGDFPEAETLTLEWVGLIPGKREGRRFEGDYMLTQRDVLQRRRHHDAVAYGGWSIDLHPADGLYGTRAASRHHHAPGVYQIPYRSLYSRDVANLFLSGRLISASHVAFGSTRVMLTCAQVGEAVGAAAALCVAEGTDPRAWSAPDRVAQLQRTLLRGGAHIPGLPLADPDDLARTATVTATSRLRVAELAPDGRSAPLSRARAQLLPLARGPVPAVTVRVDATERTELVVELRLGDASDSYTPDAVLDRRSVSLTEGLDQPVNVQFEATLDEPRYAFVCLLANPAVAVRTSAAELSGLAALQHRSTQPGEPEAGVPEVEFWAPDRDAPTRALALRLDPPLDPFRPEQLTNGHRRPTDRPNVWVADAADPDPRLVLRWDRPVIVGRLVLSFDTEFDHPMESVLLGHPHPDTALCVRSYEILDDGGRTRAKVTGNRATRNEIVLDDPVTTSELSVRVTEPGVRGPATVYEVRCYER
jgi:hypothetical protein